MCAPRLLDSGQSLACCLHVLCNLGFHAQTLTCCNTALFALFVEWRYATGTPSLFCRVRCVQLCVYVVVGFAPGLELEGVCMHDEAN